MHSTHHAPCRESDPPPPPVVPCFCAPGHSQGPVCGWGRSALFDCAKHGIPIMDESGSTHDRTSEGWARSSGACSSLATDCSPPRPGAPPGHGRWCSSYIEQTFQVGAPITVASKGRCASQRRSGDLFHTLRSHDFFFFLHSSLGLLQSLENKIIRHVLSPAALSSPVVPPPPLVLLLSRLCDPHKVLLVTCVAGSSEAEAQFKGWQKHFNTYTVRGRSNITYVTVASFALIGLYNYLKPKKAPKSTN
ncbi:hypothetical protein JTE90_003710 [Oedothorax gibbosus]|uniref:Uncharacterized protein n=1 Tax=Oedothorax gibbosus TaxID=931172 RepID=A0AAV6V9V1_9ARAC|nr:hypothetical protein JTE90_003710 [Oedothorax gibbosus]